MTVNELIALLREYPASFETNITRVYPVTGNGPIVLLSDSSSALATKLDAGPQADAPAQTTASKKRASKKAK